MHLVFRLLIAVWLYRFICKSFKPIIKINLDKLSTTRNLLCHGLNPLADRLIMLGNTFFGLYVKTENLVIRVVTVFLNVRLKKITKLLICFTTTDE